MKFRLSAFVLALVAFATIAMADPRPWTFTYDTYPIGKGKFEYEQYFTWENYTADDHGFDSFNFKHEIEYGVADNFDVSFYFFNWHYEDSATEKGAAFDEVAVETILYLSNPVSDPVGVGLYAEFVVGDHLLEFEQKLLLQKDIGNWSIGYNLVIGTEIEDVGRTDTSPEVGGAIENVLGVSYALSPTWTIGAEGFTESEYANWSEYEGTVAYAGPNASYRNGRFWITTTPAILLTNHNSGEPVFNWRFIAGWEFN